MWWSVARTQMFMCSRVDNTKSISQSISTASLVTRVKVLGQADDDGNSPVEATVDGLTKYGIRQRIYTRGKRRKPG